MKKNIRKYMTTVVCLSLVSLLMTSCATTGANAKERMGTGTGAAIGAAIAGVFGGKKNREFKVISAAILGGIIGNRIGSHLDERDRAALNRKTQEVLNTASIGKKVIWRSNHSNASAEITVTNETIEKRKIPIAIHDASGVRKTSTILNVRNGPGISFDEVSQLSSGAKVYLHGYTDNEWYLVENERGISGFVKGQYLRKISNETKVSNSSAVSESRPKMISQYTKEISVISERPCKDVRIMTKVNGKIEVTTAKSCQDPNGSWGA